MPLPSHFLTLHVPGAGAPAGPCTVFSYRKWASDGGRERSAIVENGLGGERGAERPAGVGGRVRARGVGALRTRTARPGLNGLRAVRAAGHPCKLLSTNFSFNC